MFAVISNHLRLDRGTETVDMATMHAFLIEDADASSSDGVTVHYGPSTNNKIKKATFATFIISVN